MERQEVLRLRDQRGDDLGGSRGPERSLSARENAGDTRLGAFVPGPWVERAPTGCGPLDGLTFAVKDLIDVEGVVTGAGNPDWAATHGAATRTAPAVAALLHAGARLAGKTITDELAFSLEGANHHYGTPLNPRAPDRLPGGSSSGSAAAVAGGAVDFALGTDTGGSVRVPAAFCGLFGFRPTHGVVSLDGVVPFAPSYDTVGVLARDAGTIDRVMRVLIGAGGEAASFRHVLIAEDAFALADPAVARALRDSLPDALADAKPVAIFDAAPGDWREAYRVLQGHEIRQTLGPWIAATEPRFGPAIKPRFADAASINQAETARWKPWRQHVRRQLAELLGPDGVLILPTAPTVAPLKRAAPAEIGDFYASALALTSIAGHTGFPAATLPIAAVGSLPVGLSVVATAGNDLRLTALAARLQTHP